MAVYVQVCIARTLYHLMSAAHSTASTQIIFATAFEQIFFHTTPSILSVIGTIIIVGSAIYVAVRLDTLLPCSAELT